jgi:hypothetical protein
MKLRYLVIALAFVATFASGSWGQSKQQTPPPTQSAQSNQPPKTYERGTDQSPVIVKVLPTKESDEKAAADSRREDEKTANDRSLARFTELLFWATGALCIIALCQLFVFGWQGIQLKRTVDITKESVNLARREFISSHRPKIRLKHIWLSSSDGATFTGKIVAEEPITVRLDVVNFGDATAFLELINFITEVIPEGNELPQRPRYNQPGIKQFQTGNFPLESGVTFTLNASDGRVLSDQEIASYRNRSIKIYFVGTIQYRDETGLPRQTAFCRYLSFATGSGDFGHFKREDNPDYEYQD